MPLLFESERTDSMPKKIDPQLRARCVRLVRKHQQEYPTLPTDAEDVTGAGFGLRGQRSVWFAPGPSRP